MPRDSNQYRESGGVSEGIDRFIMAINRKMKREVQGTTIVYANHLQRKTEFSRQDMLNAMHSPLRSAVRVNQMILGVSKFHIAVGVDSLTDDVVLG